ncbi:YqjF family protein [Actinospongicola halichondriae]|uniref:YqjF family protein n=1 Tax=Actinospongicola halichondriae TaxID=3236844 RepID=UPI003D556EB2
MIQLPWVMNQRWEHLLYLHYRVDAAEIADLVHPDLTVDEFDGSAWVTLIPLQLEAVHLRDLPPIPGTTHFPELNLRTYVTNRGRPGVWFLSIDAMSWFSVRVAKRVFRLPYADADMHFGVEGGAFRATSRRHGPVSATFDATFAPTSAPLGDRTALDEFLGERYCMYTHGWRGRLDRGDISHVPWVLRSADVEVRSNEVLDAAGVHPLSEPVTAYSDGTHAIAWPLVAASREPRAWPRR